MDDGRDDLPRISVDSVQDWKRVKENYRAAVLAQFDEGLIAQGLTKDRAAYLPYITDYIERTFTVARPNVRVNGRNLEELDEEEEDMVEYDEGLDRQIWSLFNQRLEWNQAVANKRRALPSDVEGVMQTILDTQREGDQEILDLAAASPIVVDTDVPANLKPKTRDVFQKMAATVDELYQSAPVNEERIARVNIVTEEIKARK